MPPNCTPKTVKTVNVVLPTFYYNKNKGLYAALHSNKEPDTKGGE